MSVLDGRKEIKSLRGSFLATGVTFRGFFFRATKSRNLLPKKKEYQATKEALIFTLGLRVNGKAATQARAYELKINPMLPVYPVVWLSRKTRTILVWIASHASVRFAWEPNLW